MREESRALQAPLAFRGFLVPQDLLGKVESLVIREFLETLEQLAHWDLEENGEIQGKEESQEQLDSLARREWLEDMVLMVQRAVQDQLAPLEIQAHQVFKACLEKEELQELLAPKVTEVA